MTTSLKRGALFLGIVFRTISYAERTLATLDKELDVVLLECVSPESDTVRQRLANIATSWQGSFTHVLYSENLIGEAYRKYLTDHPALLDQYSFVVISDMDVEFDPAMDWEKCLQAFDTLPKVGAVSLLCSDVNHKAQFCGQGSIECVNALTLPNGLRCGQPIGVNTGLQAVMMRSAVAKQFFVQSPTIPVIDTILGAWLRQHDMLWFAVDDFRVVHLMWYAYADAASQPDDVQRYLTFKRTVYGQWNRTGVRATVLFEVKLH